MTIRCLPTAHRPPPQLRGSPINAEALVTHDRTLEWCVERIRLVVTIVVLSTLTSVVFAQHGFRRGYAPAPDQPLVGEPKEWTFARLAYDGSGFRGGGSWATDYPRAEYHFSQAVERLTRIDVHPDGYVVSPNSD